MVTVQLYSRLYTRCTVHSLSSRTDLMSMLLSKNWRHLIPNTKCPLARPLPGARVMFKIWILKIESQAHETRVARCLPLI